MTTLISVAGDDPGDGVRAGLQADAEMAHRIGVHFRGVVAVDTLQDAGGLRDVRVRDSHEVEVQLRDALAESLLLGPVAVKTGALGTAAMVEAVARVAEDWPEVPWVVDPVRGASQRHPGAPALLDDAGWEAMQTALFPHVGLVTPNAHEYGDGAAFGAARAVLVTGGEEPDPGADQIPTEVIDRLIVDGVSQERRESRLPGAEHLHGTGCRLTAAIAIGWAQFGELDAALSFAQLPLRAWMAEQLGLKEPPSRSTP